MKRGVNEAMNTNSVQRKSKRYANHLEVAINRNQVSVWWSWQMLNSCIISCCKLWERIEGRPSNVVVKCDNTGLRAVKQPTQIVWAHLIVFQIRENHSFWHNTKLVKESTVEKYRRRLVTCGFKPFNFPGSFEVVVSQAIEYKNERNQSYQNERHCHHIYNHHCYNHQTKLTTKQNIVLNYTSNTNNHLISF